METGVTLTQIIAELLRSPHGKLADYCPIGLLAAKEQDEFFAHAIAWNATHGAIRDAQVALPVLALTASPPSVFMENAYAHLALLSPRDLVRAYRFAKDLPLTGHLRAFRRLLERYLRAREAKRQWWERTAVHFRAALKELYALGHVRPSTYADSILFKKTYPEGSVFDVIKCLPTMSDAAAADAIMEHQLPALVIMGQLGKRAAQPMMLLPLLERMTPLQVVTHTALLQRLGVKNYAETRAAFDEKLAHAQPSLKTTRAADAVGDAKLSAKLHGAQERQLDAAHGIEGNWLILGDKSASMRQAIQTAREIAAILARMVRSKVHLVFFDTMPRGFDVTGCSFEEIVKRTQHVRPQGGTSIGCGLQYAYERHFDVDGICIISDGGENTYPSFAQAYCTYVKAYTKILPVYFYHVSGDNNILSGNCQRAGIDVQQFEVDSIDYYALPTLVQTMRSQRYSLIDEIFATPLLMLPETFKEEKIYAESVKTSGS